MKKYFIWLLLITVIIVASFGVGAGVARIKNVYFSRDKENIVINEKETLELSPTKSVNSSGFEDVSFRIAPEFVTSEKDGKPCRSIGSDGILVGPRGNAPMGAPKEEGFSEFAIPVPGILGRSGRTTEKDLLWLKSQGWKGIVNTVPTDEHNGKDDDTLIAGFGSMGFHYLHLPIGSGDAPTEEQAETFLSFVNDPANQPVLVHCSAGHRRTGGMVILYRYSVQGWSLEKAYQEYDLFTNDPVNKAQKEFFNTWAAKHNPGSFACDN